MLNVEDKKQSLSLKGEPLAGTGKKILFIVPQPFFEDRGSPFRVKVSVESLTALDYEVDLLVLALGEEIEIPKVNIIRTWKIPFVKRIKIGPSFLKLVYDFLLFLKALELGVRNKYSVIHGVEEGGVIAAVIGKVKKTPYIFDMHSCMSEQLSATRLAKIPFFIKFVEWVERLSIRGAAGVVTVGEEHKLRVKKICSSVCCCPVEDVPLDSSDENQEQLLEKITEEFDLKDKKVVVYTGNFEPYQGIDLLLQSWASVFSELNGAFSDESTGVALLLVGGGSEEGGAISHYREMASELGISKTVIFAGQRPAREMGVFMELSRVLVSPRISGANTPLKIYSYMAAKRPVLATRITSHLQVLNDETAYMVDCCSKDFGSTLAALLDFTEEEAGRNRADIVERAFAMVNARFSRKEFFKRYASLYQQIS